MQITPQRTTKAPWITPPNPQHQEGGDRTDSGSDTHHGRRARDDAHHDRHAGDLTRKGARKRGEDAGRSREVRSIRGGGRRIIALVREYLGGEEMERKCDTGSITDITTPGTHKEAARADRRAGG